MEYRPQPSSGRGIVVGGVRGMWQSGGRALQCWQRGDKHQERQLTLQNPWEMELPHLHAARYLDAFSIAC